MQTDDAETAKIREALRVLGDRALPAPTFEHLRGFASRRPENRPVRWVVIAIGAVLAAITMSFLIGDDERRDGVVAGPDTTSTVPQVWTPPGVCRAASELIAPEGLVGAPVEDVLPQGLGESFNVADITALSFSGSDLEGEWYAVSTSVTDAGGRHLGVAVWVMPDPIVATVGDFHHLYAADQLARVIAQWEPSPVPIPSEIVEAARACTDGDEAQPFVTGELLAGGTWVLTQDPAHGLCVSLRDLDIGCDDIGSVIPADADRATPRIAISETPPGLSEDEVGELAYGMLPGGATSVELLFPDGSGCCSDAVVDVDLGLWAAPVQSGNLPSEVRYRDEGGSVVASFEISGD